MKYKLNEKDLQIINKVSSITFTDYQIDNQDYIEADNLVSAIIDLLYEVDYLKEKIEDIEADRDENWQPIPYKEQIDYCEKDFC